METEQHAHAQPVSHRRNWEKSQVPEVNENERTTCQIFWNTESKNKVNSYECYDKKQIRKNKLNNLTYPMIPKNQE